MSNSDRDQPKDAPLNPALKSTTERVYDTKHPSPPPIDTTSAVEGEGEGWPIVWAVVTVLGVLFAIYLMS
jgi:hypothetical protein